LGGLKMAPFRTVRKKIGDLLIERRVINREQLSKALEEQKKKGGYLSQHLISLGFATELDIANCLSNQYNFAYLPLRNYNISPEVMNIIPLKWIKIYTLIPIDKVGNVLSVVMADPLNEGVIQMLCQITNLEIQVFISTYTELNEAITQYYGEKLQSLKEAYFDNKDLAKLRTTDEFIQAKAYSGRERREYLRLEKELEFTFYFHGKTFQTKTKDLSYGGVCFFSEVSLPIDTNLACKVYLKSGHDPIDVVINVLRVQIKEYEERDVVKEEKLESGYEIAGIFDFVTSEDREKLVLFLQENASNME